MRRAAALGFRVLATAVLLTGLLAAAAAQTENADGSLTLWEAEMEAASFVSFSNNCVGYRNSTSTGSLSSRTFSHEDKSWTIEDVCQVSGSLFNILFTSGSSSVDDLVDSNLEFHFGTTIFSGLTDNDNAGGSTFFISPSGLTVTAGTTYTLKFTRNTKPSAPRNLTATAASTTQIDLSWSAPAKSGGSDITGYRIEVSTDGGDSWSNLVADTSSTDTEYSHTALLSRTTRHYRVSAITDVGTGPASNTASATTADDPAVFYAAENADGSLKLWEAEMEAASFVSFGNNCVGYRNSTSTGSLSSRTFSHEAKSWTIEDVCQVSGSLFNILFTSGSSSVDDLVDSNLEFHFGTTIFSGLTDNDNAGGSTFFISPSGLTVTAGTTYTLKFTRNTKPSAPRNLTATAASTTQIDLSWSAPAKSGGSDITGYRIEVSTDGGDSWSNLVADTSSTDTEYSHTALLSRTTRHYRVSAITDVGTGPAASNTASATTADDPAVFYAAENADGSLKLWEAEMEAASFVSFGNNCVGYRNSTSTGSLSSRTFSHEDKSWTIEDVCQVSGSLFNILFTSGSSSVDDLVDSNLEFHFGTTIFSGLTDNDNAGGSTFFISPSGLTVTAGTTYTLKFTRNTKPSAPRNLTATAASTTQIDLSWSAPAKSGGSDITGYRIEVSTDGGDSWSNLVADTSSTDTEYSHTALLSRTTRHYRVSAITDVGTGPASNTASATTADDPAVFYAAENADGSLKLWEAEMEAASFVSFSNNCVGYRNSTSTGSLSSRTFSHEAKSWTIEDVCQVSGSLFNILFTSGSSSVDDLVDSNLEFHFGTTIFSGLTDNDNAGGSTFFISPSGLTVTAGTTYTLKFTRNTKPSAPRNLTATAASTTQIDLSWSAPAKSGGSDITGYRIEVSTDGGDSWSNLVADTSSTDTEYSHTALLSRTTRHYRVSAITDVGTGPAASNTASATTADDPAVFYAAENADGSLKLWEAEMEAASFVSIGNNCVGYRNSTSTGSLSSRTFSHEDKSWTIEDVCQVSGSLFNILFTSGSSSVDDLVDSNLEFHFGTTIFSSLTDNGNAGGSTFFISPSGLTVTAGTTYTLKFTRNTKPSAPRNLTATAASTTQIDLSWSAPAKSGGSDITGYRIEVSTDGGDSWSNLVADTSSTDTTHSHTGLTMGDTRHYRVSAITDVGTGPASNTASATTEDDPVFYAAENTDGSLTLWEAEMEAASFVSFSNNCVGYRNSTSTGSLSSRTFSYEAKSWTIEDVCQVSGSLFNILFTSGSSSVDDLVDSNLEFHFGTTIFSGLTDNDNAGGSTFFISPSGLTVTAGTTYTLKFTRKTKPAAPRNLHAKGDSTTQIDLFWRVPLKTGGSITGYRIEVSIDGGDSWSVLVADTSSTDTTHSHTGLTMGDTRHYRVSAINDVGTSSPSNVAFATAVATPPELSSAVVERTNSLVVRLEFDELVDTTSIPGKSAFAVKVEGDAGEVTSFTVTDEGRLGWLGLASRVRPGETVTLSYTKPATNPLKDSTNAETASFTDLPVTNETSTDFPILSMAGAEAEESGDPNNPETTMTFTVSVDTEPDFPVGVHYETEDVDATGGASCSDSPIPDYISTEGRLTLGPGESSKQVEVTICDDTVADGGETFRLVLRSTQLHESIEEIEARGTIREYGEDEETGSQTGTILNDESDIEVSIAAGAAYVEEGTDAVFTLRRTGDAEEALTVPVSVVEDGAALGAPVPESATFAAGSSQASFRVATDDDDAVEADRTVTATLAAGDAWLVAEGAESASLTVLDNDAAAVTSTSAADVTVWSADMTVVEYGTGSIGAGSADLFSNQGGTAGLAAKWLWYDPATRALKIAFDGGLDDAGSMTLHVGDLSVGFPAGSGGDSSFAIGDVDVSWTAGETLAARVSKPSAEAVSTDATLASLTVSGATLSPAFNPGVLVYRAAVEAGVETVTVKASAADDGATVSYAPAADADGALADHQVATPAGETLATATVTAADGRTARAYRVVVVRPTTVAVSFGSGSYTAVEGGAAASVTVELDADPKREVTIALTATPEGGAAAEDYTVAGSVTFGGGGALSQTVPVTAVADEAAESGERVVLGFGTLPDGVEAGATASATVTLGDAAAETANTAPAGLPEISGTAQVGEALTASVTDIADGDGLENAAFAYQWLSTDGTEGAEDVEIAGATGATHEVGPEQAGRTLKVRVTFTDDRGNEETLVSAATDAVVDRRPVSAALSVGDAAPDPERFQVRVSFADAVSGLAVDELSATRVGGDAAAVSGLAQAEAGRAWTAAVATDGAGRYVVRVAAEAAEAGARRSTAAVLAVDVDAEGNAAAVSGAAVTEVRLAAESDGRWTDGDAVRVTLAFTEPVTVETASGTPTIGLGLGGNARQASYVEGSETASLVFAYSATSDDGTVSAVSVTGDSLALNGGTIRDAAGRDADLEHPGIGNETEPPETVAPAEPLTGFTLVDASSGSEVGALADGGEVTLDNPANGSFGVLVATGADAVVGSVHLELAGAKTASRTLNAAPWSLYGDENGAVLGGGLPAGAYTLTATAYGEADAGGEVLQTLSVSFTVVAAETPPVEADALTVLFQNVPAEHGGPDSGVFTFRVFFNKEPAVSYMVLRDESFAVTGGTVRKAKRVDGRNDLREIHVEPAGWDDVAVTLASGRACGTTGAICTAGGEVLSNTLSATIKGPVAIEVADARVREAADAVLEFEVSLSRTAGGPVSVDYATADGTAKAGEDFTAASGTLTFAAGETVKTVSVAVLDDAHDEGEETMKLLLSNATGGARIRDGEATGTIENSDPIPKAWLARFGRTVADQVLEAVQGRMAAPRVPGFQGQLAGHSLGSGGPGEDELRGTEGERVPEELAEWIHGAADEDGSGALTLGGATRGDEFPGAEWQVPGVESQHVSGRDLLAGTAFSLTGGSEDGGFGGLWGRGAISYFDGREGDLSVDGEVLSAMFGADWTRGRGTAGLVLSHSQGTGGYSSPGGAGDIESALTGLYPWGRFALSRRFEVWGVAGYGSGDLTVTPEGKSEIDTDIDLSMAAAGARGTVLDGGDDGLTLAVTTDAMVVRTTSASVESSAGNLAGSEAKVTRLRLGLEGSRAVALAGGGALVPSFEIGLRHDGGDAETGMGAAFGAGLAWSDPERGIRADLRGRGLLTHEDGGFREHGYAGSLAWDPRPDTALGPSLTLSQTVGASASGGMQALLGRESMAGFEASDDAEGGLGRRLEATVGYGLPMFGDGFVGSPELGFGLDDASREVSLGWRLAEARSSGLVFGLDIVAARRESLLDEGGSERRYGVGFGWRLEGAPARGVAMDLRVEGARHESENADAEPDHQAALRLNVRW